MSVPAITFSELTRTISTCGCVARHMAISSCRFCPCESRPAGRSSTSDRPACAAASRAAPMLTVSFWAFCQICQGFCCVAWAARRQFSSTVKLG